MKKLFVFIIFISLCAVMFYIVFVNANKPLLTKDEALLIGEEKYREFLWMIDGAFNDSRYGKVFMVNGKEYSDGYTFTCTYSKKNKKSCVGKNFKEAFSQLFISSINYDDVYSNGVSFTWYKKENDNYVFSNINTCNIKRMSHNHTLNIKRIEDNQITYEVDFLDREEGTYQTHRLFVLQYEDDTWKIAKAYYHDLCYMDYYIE